MNNEIEVIDNFLPDHYFKQIKNLLMGDSFYWYWNDGILEPSEPDLYQFVHVRQFHGQCRTGHCQGEAA